jgi:hypothetical protein
MLMSNSAAGDGEAATPAKQVLGADSGIIPIMGGEHCLMFGPYCGLGEPFEHPSRISCGTPDG